EADDEGQQEEQHADGHHGAGPGSRDLAGALVEVAAVEGVRQAGDDEHDAEDHGDERRGGGDGGVDEARQDALGELRGPTEALLDPGLGSGLVRVAAPGAGVLRGGLRGRPRRWRTAGGRIRRDALARRAPLRRFGHSISLSTTGSIWVSVPSTDCSSGLPGRTSRRYSAIASSMGTSCPTFSAMYQRCSRISWKISAGSSLVRSSRGTERVAGS